MRRCGNGGGMDRGAGAALDQRGQIGSAPPGTERPAAALQSGLRRLREPDSGLVQHLAGPADEPSQAQLHRCGFQPRRLSLGPPDARAIRARLRTQGGLELGKRAVGRRVLPGGGRPALFLRERASGRRRLRRVWRLLHGAGDLAARWLRLDGCRRDGGNFDHAASDFSGEASVRERRFESGRAASRGAGPRWEDDRAVHPRELRSDSCGRHPLRRDMANGF